MYKRQVQTFGANNLLVGDGLVPAKSLQPPLDKSDPVLFNKIHVAVDTYALQPDLDCRKAVVPTTDRRVS